MALTKEKIKEIRQLKKLPDSDDIKYKDIIKKHLLENDSIIYFLNNKELLGKNAPNDEYYLKNIYPYYIIPDVQHNVQNYICFETQVKELKNMDKYRKYQQIIFYILCEKGNAIDKDTYFARHDLLAALIIDEFNWSNYFGATIHVTSNVPSVVDNDYACRTLIFEHTTHNDMAKTRKSVTRMVNHDKEYGAI